MNLQIWISSVLILMGVLFAFIASIGIVRLPDLLMRMHAATKAGTLGVGLILLGVAVHFVRLTVTIEAILTILFIGITAPIASHLIARASYFQRIRLSDMTVMDELKPHYDSHTHHLASVGRQRSLRANNKEHQP
ncbi:MAG: Na+/H+ antiporter subunit G [Gammaproteobacteria bacterium RIFCSPHIGHO2_12_FULL_41_15]|nr:MAG: Na+/H+ antiporter subunit G [Gammaproteobacteria bacterium RIFCSPHIGHO2_12_FULL_41_15]